MDNTALAYIRSLGIWMEKTEQQALNHLINSHSYLRNIHRENMAEWKALPRWKQYIVKLLKLKVYTR